MQGLLIGLGYMALIALGIFQIIMGYLGMGYHLGNGWAIALLLLALMFRLSLPITIGSFFGFTDVLHWHWSIALLFTAPGLLFLVPSVMVSIIGKITGK